MYAMNRKLKVLGNFIYKLEWRNHKREGTYQRLRSIEGY